MAVVKSGEGVSYTVLEATDSINKFVYVMENFDSFRCDPVPVEYTVFINDALHGYEVRKWYVMYGVGQ